MQKYNNYRRIPFPFVKKQKKRAIFAPILKEYDRYECI
jgi:hypothetical protein